MLDRGNATELAQNCNWNKSADVYPEKKHRARLLYVTDDGESAESF